MLRTRLVHPRSELLVAGCERDHVLSGALAVRFYIRSRPLAGMKPGGMSARDSKKVETIRVACVMQIPRADRC